MNDNTRHLTNLAGHSACLCPMCWSTPGARRFAKRRVRVAVRRSERSQINRSLADENNRDGDAAHLIAVTQLNMENMRIMRTLPDFPPWW
jgi:hypothetical protein